VAGSRGRLRPSRPGARRDMSLPPAAVFDRSMVPAVRIEDLVAGRAAGFRAARPQSSASVGMACSVQMTLPVVV
jgi:hypothetical protein